VLESSAHCLPVLFLHFLAAYSACSCLNRQLAPVLKNVQQRVLLLTGEGDLLIPSREEGPRLQKLLPRCQLKVRLISLLLNADPHPRQQLQAHSQ
jgi:hypothetical protein